MTRVLRGMVGSLFALSAAVVVTLGAPSPVSALSCPDGPHNATRHEPVVSWVDDVWGSAAPDVSPARMRPVTGAVTGLYGEARSGRRHEGIDFDGEIGDAVYAAAAGTVMWAGDGAPGKSGYGTVVMIDHGLGVETISAHLSGVAVAAGDHLRPGDRIGTIGISGWSTGSHLHFELRRNGIADDPAAWLAETPRALARRII